MIGKIGTGFRTRLPAKFRQFFWPYYAWTHIEESRHNVANWPNYACFFSSTGCPVVLSSSFGPSGSLAKVLSGL